MIMKRIFTLFWVISAVCTLVFYSCSSEDNDVQPTGNTELEGFFKSSAYSAFAKSYKLKESNLLMGRSTKQHFSDQRLNLYFIPVVKKGQQVGLLQVVSKDNGAVYKTVYQNLEKFDPKIGGEVTIEINKRFVARAKYTVTSSSKNGASVLVGGITEVADVNTIPMAKSRSEWNGREEDEGWWACTTRCYQVTKQNEDATDEMLCDILAIAIDLCTIFRSAGCAGICAVS